MILIDTVLLRLLCFELRGPQCGADHIREDEDEADEQDEAQDRRCHAEPAERKESKLRRIRRGVHRLYIRGVCRSALGRERLLLSNTETLEIEVASVPAGAAGVACWIYQRRERHATRKIGIRTVEEQESRGPNHRDEN
jgi:hypothetical protein